MPINTPERAPGCQTCRATSCPPGAVLCKEARDRRPIGPVGHWRRPGRGTMVALPAPGSAGNACPGAVPSPRGGAARPADLRARAPPVRRPPVRRSTGAADVGVCGAPPV
jgi:hypothetical protein